MNQTSRDYQRTLWADDEALESSARTILERHAFPVQLAEQMLWLADTLAVLGRVRPEGFSFYLKGGTCVQHYLALGAQRFSKDIDLALIFEGKPDNHTRTRLVGHYVGKVNRLLTSRGFDDTEILSLPSTPPGDVVVPVCRHYPPRYSPSGFHGLCRRTGAWISVDFFKQDLHPEYKLERIRILAADQLRTEVMFPLATKERLLADKVIVLFNKWQNPEGDEFKDVLDVAALRSLDPPVNNERAAHLLSLWARSKAVKATEVTRGARQAVERLTAEVDDERLTQTNGILPRQLVFADVETWKDFCQGVLTQLTEFESRITT